MKHIFLEGEKIPNNKTHGTGCSLSSAIASNLAKGYSMLDSVKKAKIFVLCSIKNSIDFGEIGGTVNQMGEIYKNIDIEKTILGEFMDLKYCKIYLVTDEKACLGKRFL